MGLARHEYKNENYGDIKTMPTVMKEIYWLIFIYKFSPEIIHGPYGYKLRLTAPHKRYFTDYLLGDKITHTGGVDPWRIFKRKKGFPPK